MAFLRKIKAGLVKFPVDQYIGEEGQIFYNVETGELYISDGVTVGGTPIGAGSVDETQVNALIDTRVDKPFVDALNVDADTLDGIDSTGFASATDLSNLEATVNTLDTDSVPEGSTNLYYTAGRFDGRLATKTTDDLAEGSNLYFTNPRAVTAVGGSLNDSGTTTTDLWSADKIATEILNSDAGIQTTTGITDNDQIIRTNTNGYLDASFLVGRSTDDLSEGSNLYFTDTRAVTAVGGSVNDAGTATDDLWSADQITSYVVGQAGPGGALGVQVTSGATDADKIIRTDSNGYLDASFLTNTTTDDITEGSNLFYTAARADAQIDLHKFTNVYYVDLTPVGDNEYSSIGDAITAINTELTLSQDNQAVVLVGPGLYNEAPFTLPSWVTLHGHGLSTVLKPTNNTVPFITAESQTTIEYATLFGPLNNGQATIVNADSANSGTIRIEEVDFEDADSVIRVVNDGVANLVVLLRNCVARTTAEFTNPFYFETSSTGTVSFLSDSYGHALFTPSVINNYVRLTGPNTTATISTWYINDQATSSISNMFYVEDGATLIDSNSIFFNADTTYFVPNAGDGPTLQVSGSVTSARTWDVNILNPNTTGVINGSGDRDKLFTASDSVTLFSVDATGTATGIGVTGEILQGPSISRLINFSALVRATATMGVVEGGELSLATGRDVNVAAGFGYLVDSSDDTVVQVNWTGTTLTIPNDTQQWIVVEPDGTVALSGSSPNNLFNFIILGRVFAENNVIQFIEDISNNALHQSNEQTSFFRDALGPIYASGSIVTENATARNLNITAGRYYYGSNRFTPTGGVQVPFNLIYRDGSGGYVSQDSELTVPVQWDNDSGTLQTPQAGFYVKHALYVVGDGNSNEMYFLVVGQAEDSNLSVTEQAPLPTPPSYLQESVTLIAAIIVQEGQTNLVQIRDERPIIGFRASGVSASSTHGNLLGLADDDHLQYLRTDGGRIMTGNLNVGGQNIINVNLIDGVDVSLHGSRHLPNGADPLATAVPNTIGTANAEGIQNSYARSDHVHDHGQQTDGSLHAVATQSVAGFLSTSDKTFIDGLTGTGTDGLTEGSTNLYYTDERVDDRLNNLLVAGADIIFTYDDGANTLTVAVNSSSTSVADTVVRRDANKSFGTGYIVFDQENPASEQVGQLTWNTDTGGLEVGMEGGQVRLQIGQEMLSKVFNNTGATISDGTVVTIQGSVLDILLAELAVATSDPTERFVLGVATEDILDQGTGFVTSYGVVRGLDTSAFTSGDNLYLSDTTPGVFVNTRPSDPSREVFVGVVVRSSPTEGAIFVNPDIAEGIENLSNVELTNVQDGEIIQWQTNKFVNTDGFSTFASLSDFNTLETTVNNLTTDDVTEGSNLYYTQARFDTAFGNKDTDALSEGVSNLYFTPSRAISAVGGSLNDAGTTVNDLWSADKIATEILNSDAGIQSTAGAADADKIIRTDSNGFLDPTFLAGSTTDDLSEGVNNLYYTSTRFDNDFAGKTTTDLTEGTNLYFTNTRAVTAIGGQLNDAGTGTDDLWSATRIISYADSRTGVAGTDGIQSTTGPVNEDTLIRTDNNGRLDDSFIDLDRASSSAQTTFSTTSTAFTVISGTTITPPAGTYMVTFNASINIAANNSSARYAIYRGGSIVTDSERQFSSSSTNNTFATSTITLVTVTGAETLEARIRNVASANTINVFERSIVAVRVGF